MQKVEHIGLKPVGEPGPTLLMSGRWDSNKAYTRDSEVLPLVEYEGLFYSLNKIGTTQGGLNPKDDYAKNGSKATWKLQNSYEMIIVKAIVADGGLLGDFVFWGSKMFSKQGVDRQGKFSDSYTEYPKGNFIPNYTVDAITGEIIALKGKFGSFEIDGEDIICKTSKDKEIVIFSSSSVPTSSLFEADWDVIQRDIYLYSEDVSFYQEDTQTVIKYRHDAYLNIDLKESGEHRLDGVTSRPMTIEDKFGNNVWDRVTHKSSVSVKITDSKGLVIYHEKRIPIQDSYDGVNLVFMTKEPTEITVEIGFDVVFNTTISEIFINMSNSIGYVLHNKVPQKVTFIGNDGLYTSFNSREFLHYKGGEGFSIRSGNFGLRVSPDGIQKWNGSKWIAANI